MLTRLKCSALVLLGALVAAVLLAGCGADQPTVYRPSSFGEDGHCYYVNDLSEVRELQQAGLCPSTWIAYPMPLSWRQRYDDYYGSPDYYTHYVVIDRRTVYVRGEEEFRRTNGPSIGRERAKATYTDTKGKKTYSGGDVVKSRSAASAGSGGLGGGQRGGGLGGGNRTTTVKSKTKTSAGK